MKKLPLNKNDFKEIITGDYLYVDKTYIFFHIFKNYDIYFLMRPSGFGKTLFLSTLRYYLSGEGSLFQGLAIGGDVLFKSAEPLIFLDFNPEDSATLEDNTLAKIKTSAELNGINIQEKASHLALAEL
ncbi:MAG: AAA family ATPase, partial [Deltaproteobacteria bacterium]|nr:AAA family ATPase [Deltaproteobacteria bacterium]